MKQHPPLLPPPGPAHPGAGQDERIDFRVVGTILRRNRWLILGIMLAAVALAALVTRFQTPIYQSDTLIRIKEEQPALGLLGRLAPAGLAGVAGLGGASDVQTDLLVLQSRQIAEAVTDSLALQIRLLEPEDLPRVELLRVINAPRSSAASIYTLTLQHNGRYSVEREQGRPIAGDAAEIEAGQPFRLGGATLALLPVRQEQRPARIRVAIQPFRAAVAEVQRTLRVDRPDPAAQLVRIGYRDPDPWIAAAVPNTATRSFVRLKNTVQGAESNVTLAFLREQVAEYGEALRNAEVELQRFREQARIISPEDQATEEVRRFAALRAERESLQAEAFALRRLLDRLETAPDGPGGESPYRQLASFPRFLSNAAVQDVLRTLTELETERGKLLALRTPQNVDVQVLTQRIGQLEQELNQLARNYLLNLDNSISAADESLARSNAEMATIPASEVGFLRRVREQKLLEEVYGLLQTKLKEEEIQAASEASNISLIDPALIPEHPSSPRPILNLAIGLLLGGIVGVGAAFVRHAADHKVRTRDDVLAATSGAPVLGAIPRQLTSPQSNGSGRRLAGLARAHGSHDGQALVTRFSPGTPAAEAYRVLRTHLAAAVPQEAPRVLMITSALAGEGKSSSASNLAVALAQHGTHTLLVDADLRAGILHEVFAESREPGLADVLLGRAELADALRQIPSQGAEAPLWLLPAGCAVSHPAELLGSVRARALMAGLREQFDVTILDAPPLVPVADAAVLGTLADSTLVVARTGVTDRRALEDAATQLRQLRIPIAGVVLQDAEATRPRYGGIGRPYGS